MTFVRRRVADYGVPYYYVSFKTLEPPQVFFDYARRLAPDVPAFAWDGREGQTSEMLDKMIVPFYLLVDADGTILRTWPGSSTDASDRRRMSNQIIADVAAVTSRPASARR